MKIGIFGGSFNPPHKMHKKIALELIKKHYVDKVIFVPTGNKYKYKNNLLSDNIRLEMLKLMCIDNEKLEVSDYELKEQVVYTYETLDYFKNKYKDDEIYFICGTDNLSYIDKWKKGEYILSNNKILVIKRNTDDINTLLNKYKDYKDNIIVTDIKENEISSTKIREMIYNNKRAGVYLDKKVYSYIKDNNLYKGDDFMNFKEIIHILQLGQKTIATMESCTGGGVVNAITNCEGASEVLKYSAVTYSNEYKVKMGVPKEVIDKYTVYSMETAIEMSKAISSFANSNYGIGITGKLNRSDPNNKVGDDNTVYICIYDRDNNKFYKEKMTVNKESRALNKEHIIDKIITMLLDIIK